MYIPSNPFLKNRQKGLSKNKYGNVQTMVDGIRFDSKAEATRWSVLMGAEKEGLIVGLERQVKFPIRLEGKHLTSYVADFVYTTIKKKDVIEDVKNPSLSKPGTVFDIKRRAVKILYGVDVTVVHPRDVLVF